MDGIQTPCVADPCRAVFDRRFLLEEGFDATKAEIVALLERVAADMPEFRYELRDLMVVHPVRTPEGSPLVAALERRIQRRARPERRRWSPAPAPTTRSTSSASRGIPHCVAYGPGILDLAHQPDEWCGVEDLVNATKVLALAVLDLTGTM